MNFNELCKYKEILTEAYGGQMRSLLGPVQLMGEEGKTYYSREVKVQLTVVKESNIKEYRVHESTYIKPQSRQTNLSNRK